MISESTTDRTVRKLQEARWQLVALRLAQWLVIAIWLTLLVVQLTPGVYLSPLAVALLVFTPFGAAGLAFLQMWRRRASHSSYDKAREMLRHDDVPSGDRVQLLRLIQAVQRSSMPIGVSHVYGNTVLATALLFAFVISLAIVFTRP